MTRITIILILLTALAAPFAPTNAKLKKIYDMMQEGLDYVHNCDYSNSLRVYKQVMKEMPDHPVGYFYYSAALQSMMTDYRNFEYGKVFLKEIDHAIELAEKMVKKDKEDAWAYFYRGAVYGYRGIYHADYGGWYRTLKDGLQGNRDMKKAVELDPKIVDAYYGIGMFQYWKSEKAENFYWLPFLKNEKPEGIRNLFYCRSNGYFTADEASLSLIRIYYTEEEYEKAVKLGKQVLAKFPDYIFCYWYLGKSYYELGQYDKALENYLWIADHLDRSPYTDPIAVLEIDYYLARTYYKQGKLQKALEFIAGIDKSRVEVDADLEIFEDFRDDVEELKEKVLYQLNPPQKKK